MKILIIATAFLGLTSILPAAAMVTCTQWGNTVTCTDSGGGGTTTCSTWGNTTTCY